ncbi:MAG TPA: LemA family protein [Blastocatellia bacterium]
MRKRNLPAIFHFMPFLTAAALSMWIGQAIALAQTGSGAKTMKKDELYLSIARRLNSVSETPSSAVANELDTVIEVTNLTMLPDGKAEATVKERSPSNDGKSIRLIFAPPAAGDAEEKWTWEQFENNRRFYPVEKLFPYAKDELGRRKQATVSNWNEFIAAISKQSEAANRALETAKAVLKADPPPLAEVKGVRQALAEAVKENRIDDILNAYRELNQQTEPVTALGDAYADLKANDAYLRLTDEFKKSIEATNAARKNYLQAVAAYNEAILRLPFSLVAYGLEFHKIEASISEDQ